MYASYSVVNVMFINHEVNNVRPVDLTSDNSTHFEPTPQLQLNYTPD